MRETNAIRAARDAEPDPYRRLFTFPKWNRLVRVTDEHSLFRRLPEFAAWDRKRHGDTAHVYLVLATVQDAMHADIVKRAEHIWGDHGPLISGVVREHFPDPVKDALRLLAHSASEYRDRSIAHWRASGRTLNTWRRLRDAVVKEYGG